MRGFRQFLVSIWEVVQVILIAVVAVFLIRTFLIQPFLVSGASMEPNFSDGDYLFVDRLTYRFREPKRGEVLVFRYPQQPSTFFIKRVIGLPGETVMIQDSEIHIITQDEDEISLNEIYLPPSIVMQGNFNATLQEGEYFVMGDNRNFSFDSRNWGSLESDKVIGMVRLRIFPFTAFGAINAPNY